MSCLFDFIPGHALAEGNPVFVAKAFAVQEPGPFEPRAGYCPEDAEGCFLGALNLGKYFHRFCRGGGHGGMDGCRIRGILIQLRACDPGHYSRG